LKRPRFRLGLLGRLALALAAVGLVPLAVTSVRLLRMNEEALVEQVLRTHSVAAKTAAGRVAAFLETRSSLARGAAESPELANPRSPVAQQLLIGNLQAWADLGVLGIAVLDPQGQQVVRAQLRGNEARPAVAAALRAPGPFAGVAVTGRSPLVLRFGAPLAAGGGFLVLVCQGEQLHVIARPEELGDQADLILAQRGGTVVAGSVPTLAGLPQELLDLGLSGRVAGAARFHSGGSGSGMVLGAYAPVPGSSWVVLSRQPAQVAEAVAARMRGEAGAALGFAALLSAGLLAGAWYSVVRPIRGLVAAQRNLVGGAVGAGGNEIDDLRRTFEALARSLSERQSLENVFLGRYQVMEALGSGAMGSVFRGWDPRLQRPVALKTIHLGSELEPERRKSLLATLLREGVALARLSHPNVVAAYDLEDVPEGAYIAMEYVEGINLESLLRRRGRLTPEEAVLLGAAIARGIAAAHEQGIVHRDVKPSNVLLGRNGAIKVTDFGIAGFLAGAAEDAETVFGTPGYLPPESLLGHGHGKTGDLFALGVLLYRCIASVMPFAGSQPEDVLRATLFGMPTPLRERVSKLPIELDTLVQHLLDRDPDRRPASAAAVAAELERMAAVQRLTWQLAPEDAAAGPGWAEDDSLTGAARWVSTRRVG
jgi:serine/threonine-protein kinase